MESIKTKLALAGSLGIIGMTYGMQGANAILATASGVVLEPADEAAIMNGAMVGITTQFESLKLIGVVVLVGAVGWILTKVFSAVKIGGSQ